jgi:DNA polymerase-3 subunit alpha
MPNAKGETFVEVLVRYGNKYQQDKAAAANSLFGGENMVEVATQEIIHAPEWSDLDRLNKERDLVGIYLSAHPLDEYEVILENVCNVKMAALSDLTPLQNLDLILGGIVTGVREGYTKTGKPYGIAKVEDYSGSAEFAFFGNDWIEKKNFFNIGMFLYMKGKCQPKQWRQDEYEVKVNTIELLPDVKESVIEKLTINAPLTEINDELIEELSSLVKSHPGNVELNFHIQDDEGQQINLTAKTLKINVLFNRRSSTCLCNIFNVYFSHYINKIVLFHISPSFSSIFLSLFLNLKSTDLTLLSDILNLTAISLTASK